MQIIGWDKADFEAMNEAAGNGLRLMRKNKSMSTKELAALLGITDEILRAYETGITPIPAAHLYYADKIFKGGYDFYFFPYCRPELFSKPITNVVPFPFKKNR